MKFVRMFLLVGSMLLAAGVLLAPSAVSIKLNPKTGFPPLDVRGYITIEPDTENRYACLIVEGGNEHIMSCRDIDGANGVNGLKTTVAGFTLKLPGTYYAQVVLYRAAGRTIVSNTEMIRVVGDTQEESSGGDPRINVRNTR